MSKGVVPFDSPKAFEVEFDLPHGFKISGMGASSVNHSPIHFVQFVNDSNLFSIRLTRPGIPRGITVLVGGGFHGKSTLLRALEVGCYNKVPGDGREFVVADPTAVKVRAEDGRAIAGVDIHAYINNLPFEKDTTQFSTEDASGSTSQAANIIEALEQQSSLLLLDEDTCATNFMIRDTLMQRLVAREKEPITPFIASVREIYEQLGTSVIMVIGSAGDYFAVADTVLMMDHYRPVDVTDRAKVIATEAAGTSTIPPTSPNGAPQLPARLMGDFKLRQLDRGSFQRLAGNRCFARTLGTVSLARDPLPDGTLDELDLGELVLFGKRTLSARAEGIQSIDSLVVFSNHEVFGD